MAHAAQELERLRARQEGLEREKRDLEDVRRKQEEYEQGKREMIERFGQSLVKLEKDEAQAERLSELLGATRKRFKNLLDELQAINEQLWPEDQIRDELSKALTVIEDARMEYNKAMSKLDAISADGRKVSAEHPPVIFEEGRFARDVDRSFGYWVKVGFAVSLPLIVVAVAVTAIVLILKSSAVI
jgi:ethanolamine utilization protein EutA (predicted chaperonin)